MECPECKTDISAVYIVSEYARIGQLSGFQIAEYEEVSGKSIGKTIRIECSECSADITNLIEE